MNAKIKSPDWWKYKGYPADVGWYAVLVCYDSEEGSFPQADYFNGVDWTQKEIVAFGEKCDSKEDALELAYKHDPDL